jgi:hypothetical protein
MATHEMQVPTILETELTGLLGAYVGNYRGVDWRVEFYRCGAKATRNGEPFSARELPKPIYERALKVKKFLLSSPK